jgi:RNA polymerase-binding transcription factor DksA
LLKERHQRLSEVSEALEPHSMDMADSATDEFDHNLALSGLSAGQDSLYEVEAALNRILNGTYGVCEETEQPIPAARLTAVPWTRFTREVEERLETKGVFTQPHLAQVNSVRGDGTGNLEEGESFEQEAEESVANDEALKHVFALPVKREPRAHYGATAQSKREPTRR